MYKLCVKHWTEQELLAHISESSPKLNVVWTALCIFSLVTQRQRADEKNREKILKEEKRKEREQLEGLKQQRRAEVRFFALG